MLISHDKVMGNNGKPILLDYRFDDALSPKAVLIFCHGYKGFKDWGAWNLMADKFSQLGFAFVKFNFSHNGIGEGDLTTFSDLEAFSENNYSKECQDLSKVVAWVAQNDHFKKLPIYVIGHSRGGGIALLEGIRNQKVKGIISLAAVCDFGNRFPLGQAFEEWKEKGVYHVKNGRTGQSMPHRFSFYEDYTKNKEALDIRSAVKTMLKPLLILHAMNDEAVHVSAAMKLKKWNSKARLYLYPKGNHTFETSHPWTEQDLPQTMQDLVRDVEDFLKMHL